LKSNYRTVSVFRAFEQLSSSIAWPGIMTQQIYAKKVVHAGFVIQTAEEISPCDFSNEPRFVLAS